MYVGLFSQRKQTSADLAVFFFKDLITDIFSTGPSIPFYVADLARRSLNSESDAFISPPVYSLKSCIAVWILNFKNYRGNLHSETARTRLSISDKPWIINDNNVFLHYLQTSASVIHYLRYRQMETTFKIRLGK